MINPIEYQKIAKETQRAVKLGWDYAKIEWREMALRIVYQVCVDKKFLTANDFSAEIIRNPIKTHDNRSIGGLVKAAQKMGWVVPTGEVEISKVGHLTRIQIWKSLLYVPKSIQPAMFQTPSSRQYN